MGFFLSFLLPTILGATGTLFVSSNHRRKTLIFSIIVAMEFRVPGFNAELPHTQVYPTPSASSSFNYANFSSQAIEGGPVCMKEAIQRELEKEMIREKIIAEEVERFHVWEAEVRRDLLLRREMMAMKVGMGFPSSFMVGPQPAEIRQTTQLPPKVGTGNLYAPILPEAKLKPPPSLPAGGGSSELNPCSSKKKMEWRCSICKISAPCESGLLEHLAGQKHQSKVAALKADSTENVLKTVETDEPLVIKNSTECVPNDSKDQKKPPSLPEVSGSMELSKKKMDWKCSICKVCLTSEIDFQSHLAEKKHKDKVAIVRKGKII